MAALRFIALLAVISFLSGCGERHSWHQKLILEVETPTGLISGGSVVEASVSWFGGLDKAMSSNAAANGVRGEASFVEVAPGQYLFALLDGEEAAHAIAIFTDIPHEEPREVTERLQTLKETRVIAPSKYPDFVTFTNINDPKSVKLVDPANLAAAFGLGFALKSVKLELTDEKVTEGRVKKILEWLNELKIPIGRMTNQKFGDPLYGLGKGNFFRGEQ